MGRDKVFVHILVFPLISMTTVPIFNIFFISFHPSILFIWAYSPYFSHELLATNFQKSRLFMHTFLAIDRWCGNSSSGIADLCALFYIYSYISSRPRLYLIWAWSLSISESLVTLILGSDWILLTMCISENTFEWRFTTMNRSINCIQFVEQLLYSKHFSQTSYRAVLRHSL